MVRELRRLQLTSLSIHIRHEVKCLHQTRPDHRVVSLVEDKISLSQVEWKETSSSTTITIAEDNSIDHPRRPTINVSTVKSSQLPVKYSTLGKHQIRLLHLQPLKRDYPKARDFQDAFKEDIEARFVTVNLDSHPDYEVLSYEWGSVNRADSLGPRIKLDGSEMS